MAVLVDVVRGPPEIGLSVPSVLPAWLVEGVLVVAATTACAVELAEVGMDGRGVFTAVVACAAGVFKIGVEEWSALDGAVATVGVRAPAVTGRAGVSEAPATGDDVVVAAAEVLPPPAVDVVRDEGGVVIALTAGRFCEPCNCEAWSIAWIIIVAMSEPAVIGAALLVAAGVEFEAVVAGAALLMPKEDEAEGVVIDVASPFGVPEPRVAGVPAVTLEVGVPCVEAAIVATAVPTEL